MCGRYVLNNDEMELRVIIDEVSKSFNILKTGEVFPTNHAPVLIFEGTTRKPVVMEWGFPNFRTKGVIINARAETAIEKRAFRDALLYRRCVIPSSGFYEWSKTNEKKQKDKYLFTLPHSSAVYMAGLYSEYEKDGKILKKFVILTTAANESIMGIHDRMPVVLHKDNVLSWIADTDLALNILQRYPPNLYKILV